MYAGVVEEAPDDDGRHEVEPDAFFAKFVHEYYEADEDDCNREQVQSDGASVE